MKLMRLSYNSADAEWEFDNLTFHQDVSLLVGASGVGKTRILKSIYHLRMIADGDESRLNWGVNWLVEFQDASGTSFLWQGAFERRGASGTPHRLDDDFGSGFEDDLDPQQPKIIRETLFADGKPAFARQNEIFTVHGKQLEAKLSPYASGLNILSEEDAVKPAKEAISQMLFVDVGEDADRANRIIHGNYRKLRQRYTELDDIRGSQLSTHFKLALVHEHAPEVFGEIVDAFREVFPYIEDVKVEETSFPPFGEVPIVKIKEVGVSRYFTQDDLSAGMQRTLMHLARLALWPNGTLILIDEFENSLGANCIDVVSGGLLNKGKSLQFIITSHHPFIINAIPMNRWKIIARDRGRIGFFTTEELGVGRSRQEAFTQLVNTEVFRHGILPK